VKPLYLQLHAYVRRELRKKYGEDIVSKDGPIPAHLLGNAWAQTWANIADFTIPFPGKQLPDITAALVEQGEFILMNLDLFSELFLILNLEKRFTFCRLYCNKHFPPRREFLQVY
jgi:hypothetical protein